MTSGGEDLENSVQIPGNFELPTPEQLDESMKSVESPHAGAQEAQWTTQDELHGSIHEDLPMIVWLRGDEPWFQQFDMGADDVMKSLNIRRSRLTQIAGRDLRVGRVRVDRYIRPVFRSQDVERYLAWTRATASHQKSSDAIKDAVGQLEKQTESIQSTVQQLSESLTQELKQDLQNLIAQATHQGILPIQSQMGSLVLEQREKLELLSEIMKESLGVHGSHLKSLQEQSHESQLKMAAASEVLTLQMNLLSEKTALMEEQLTAWDQMLKANLEVIRHELSELKKKPAFKKHQRRSTKNKKTTMSSLGTSENHKFKSAHAPARRKKL